MSSEDLLPWLILSNTLAKLQAQVAVLSQAGIAFGVIGRAGPGPIAAPDALVGWRVEQLLNVSGGPPPYRDGRSHFEAVISQSGSIQQTSGADLSTSPFVIWTRAPLP